MPVSYQGIVFLGNPFLLFFIDIILKEFDIKLSSLILLLYCMQQVTQKQSTNIKSIVTRTKTITRYISSLDHSDPLWSKGPSNVSNSISLIQGKIFGIITCLIGTVDDVDKWCWSMSRSDLCYFVVVIRLISSLYIIRMLLLRMIRFAFMILDVSAS